VVEGGPQGIFGDAQALGRKADISGRPAEGRQGTHQFFEVLPPRPLAGLRQKPGGNLDPNVPSPGRGVSLRPVVHQPVLRATPAVALLRIPTACTPTDMRQASGIDPLA